MIREPLPVTSQSVGEQRRFQGPVRGWELAFLVMLSLALLAAAAWESHKEYFGNDELCTAILVANPSLSAMCNTIRHGGELNPPLYFVLEWAVAQVFGSGELALRALSIASVALAGWVLFFTLRRLTGPSLAALAVALIFGLSRDVFLFACQARYYGFLFLLVSLGVWLLLRLNGGDALRRRDYALVFLTHLAIVYTHLYGGLFSAALLVAMVATDWLRGKLRWRLYGAVGAAWAAFGAWLPALAQQAKSTGAWTPSNYHALGFLFEELALQIPFALVLLLVMLVGGLAMMVARPCRAADEANACATPFDWTAAAFLAVALLAVPVATWLGSFKITALFMRRYVFPATAAWVLLTGLLALALHRLPKPKVTSRPALPPWLWTAAWVGVLGFCCTFQPLRAWKNPPRPDTPFVDEDYGYKHLPMVFEDSWYWLPRVVYGKERPYLLLTDHAAAEADAGWYTKCMDRFFRAWYPTYYKARVAHVEDLPTEFIAVDDDLTKTFEWLFQHRPELKARLLGTRPLEVAEHGHQRVYLVQKEAAAK